MPTKKIWGSVLSTTLLTAAGSVVLAALAKTGSAHFQLERYNPIAAKLGIF